MPSNPTYHLSALDLCGFATSLHEQIEAEGAGPLRIPPALVDRLGEAVSALASGNEMVGQARSAFRSAVSDREQSRESCANAVAAIARLLYANEQVGPSQIVGLGLAPRKTTRTRVVARAVPAVNAALLPSGEVALSWDRGENAKSVAFIVEARSGSEAWSFVGTTTATRMVLRGFAAGVETQFRVVASKANVRTAPSPVATIYHASALRLAA